MELKELIKPSWNKVIVTFPILIILFILINPLPYYAECEACELVTTNPELCPPCPINVRIFFVNIDVGFMNPFHIIINLLIFIIDVGLAYLLSCIIVMKYSKKIHIFRKS